MINRATFFGTMRCTLMLACVCLIVLMCIQCSRRKDRAQSDASTVTMFYGGNEWLLGPADADFTVFLIFSNLWNLTKEGVPEAMLAERWETSEDCRIWTFHLRHDVRWHDGVPFTAHDVKFSLELFAHPDVLWEGSSDLWMDMESVAVLDDFTFRVTYNRPKCEYPDDWNIFYPKHLLEDLDPKKFYRWDFWTHPIGNGPYRYVRHIPKTMMELEANPDYYRGKPKIERVVFKLGGGNRLIELLSGNVDMVDRIDAVDIPQVLADGRFRIYQSFAPWRLYLIYWNHRYSLFRDTKVRRALTMAINRPELVKVMNYPENTPIFDTIMTGGQFHRRDFPDPLPFDMERAKQLLEEAGWRDQDGDGIRERAGEEARFTAITSNIVPATYVQAQLHRVGVQMEIRPLAIGALRVRLRAGEFEAAFASSRDGLDILDQQKWFSPDSPIGYSNPEIVRLLKARKNIGISDPEAVDQIYRELMPIFCEEIPVTFLYPGVATNVAHRRIRGPEGWNGLIQENLWIEEE